MEFTLYYRGELKSNRGSKEKHSIRKVFHPQLQNLWNQVPLSTHQKYLERSKDPNELSILKEVGAFAFAPLVTEKLRMVAELNILFLRPEPPGAIITQGGDIDNRIKTLLDAFKVPAQPNSLPKAAIPEIHETPFFCLLEDDNLITNLNIETDRLLDSSNSPNEVVLIIRVKTKLLGVTYGNIGLA